MALLFLESVGTTELLLILVVALIVFGPRKLPELSRSLGKGLSEFKRASDDFKRTWEREVNLDSYERERRTTEAMLPPEEPRAESSAGELSAQSPGAPDALIGANTIARGAGTDAEANAVNIAEANAPHDGATQVAPPSANKADWL